MRSLRFFLPVSASLVLVAGCSTLAGEEQATVTTTITSFEEPASSSTSSEQVDTSSPIESPVEQVPPAVETEQVVEEAPVAQEQPTFLQCYEHNAAMMSDGSVVTDVENCGNYAVPEVDVAPNGECVGPAAVCGYGYDESGNRNPTSGEIQTYHGCQDGYITDPELCAAAAAIVEGS